MGGKTADVLKVAAPIAGIGALAALPALLPAAIPAAGAAAAGTAGATGTAAALSGPAATLAPIAPAGLSAAGTHLATLNAPAIGATLGKAATLGNTLKNVSAGVNIGTGVLGAGMNVYNSRNQPGLPPQPAPGPIDTRSLYRTLPWGVNNG